MHMDRAEELFTQGYNCAQAVLGAFAQELGLDFGEAMRLSASLGGGLGQSGEVCGAALGMCLAVGLAKGYGEEAPSQAEKDAHAERVKALMTKFRTQFGFTGCNSLRVVGNRSICMKYVRYAAALTERELSS